MPSDKDSSFSDTQNGSDSITEPYYGTSSVTGNSSSANLKTLDMKLQHDKWKLE
jgi:hypothetical protein